MASTFNVVQDRVTRSRLAAEPPDVNIIPKVGDIGLLGASTEDGREAYQVYLGGGSDHDQGLARFFAGPVAAEQLPSFLAGVIRRYLANRQGDESFLAYTRRHTDEELKAMLEESNAQTVVGVA